MPVARPRDRVIALLLAPLALRESLKHPPTQRTETEIDGATVFARNCAYC